MSEKLLSDVALKAQVDAVLATAAAAPWARRWYAELSKFISEVREEDWGRSAFYCRPSLKVHSSPASPVTVFCGRSSLGSNQSDDHVKTGNA